MKKIIPQANSLDTLVKIFIYFANKKDCSLEDIANYIDFNQRQASYYLNACYYLDLVDENGKNLTALGNEIIKNPIKIKDNIYIRILEDSTINKVFSRMLIFPNNDIKQFTTELLRKDTPEYSDAVLIRRTSTILSWCKQIYSYINEK